MSRTPLISQLAAQIAEHLRAETPQLGSRLAERQLAERFRVSRTPIRSALKLLHERGLVGEADGGGYMVLAGPSDGQLAIPDAGKAREDAAYLRIARDRVDGGLPDRVTENELARRYDLTRGELMRALHRISGEGWIERLPGHGWAFLPMLTSIDAYRDSYRYRLVIEPAAIMEPGFRLDRAALEEVRVEQEVLIAGAIWTVTVPELFAANSRLHERIIECSGNMFFINGLKRVNRLRRLMEYRQSLDRAQAIQRCREHIELLELLLADRRQEASEFLARHLQGLSVEKVALRAGHEDSVAE